MTKKTNQAWKLIQQKTKKYILFHIKNYKINDNASWPSIILKILNPTLSGVFLL